MLIAIVLRGDVADAMVEVIGEVKLPHIHILVVRSIRS
jgi:hypothetical protein